MRFYLFIIYLSIGILLFGGCQSLPPGKAPVGPIVTQKSANEKYSWQGAKNYLLTSLSMFCLQNFPQGSSFSVDFPFSDENLEFQSWEVLRSVRESVPIRLNQSEAAYRLSSGMEKNNTWAMRLTDLKTKKVVWSEYVNVKENK